MKEAAATLIKLEEARIVLNRLIGPGGSFTPQEREKHLKKAVGYSAQEVDLGAVNQSLGKLGVSAPSTKALQPVNQFYDNKTQRKQNFNQLGQPTTLADDAHEDEFWYQTPKADAGPVNNFQAPNSRGGIRKPAPGGPPRY